MSNPTRSWHKTSRKPSTPQKRLNPRIIGIEEEEEEGCQLKGTENIFNKNREQNFPNLKMNMPTKIQET